MHPEFDLEDNETYIIYDYQYKKTQKETPDA